jgi:Ser-tRNA(Ala) deacylase AlaX
MTTELLFLRDAYLQECDAVVQEVRDNAVILDQTIFITQVVVNPTTLVSLTGNW